MRAFYYEQQIKKILQGNGKEGEVARVCPSLVPFAVPTQDIWNRWSGNEMVLQDQSTNTQPLHFLAPKIAQLWLFKKK